MLAHHIRDLLPLSSDRAKTKNLLELANVDKQIDGLEK